MANNVLPVAAGRVLKTKDTYFPFTFQTETKTHSPPQNISLAAHGLLATVFIATFFDALLLYKY